MFTAMDSFKEGYRMYQRSLRIRPFNTLDKAIAYAKNHATGKPFVCKGATVIWSGKND